MIVINRHDREMRNKMRQLPQLAPRALKRALYDIGKDMYMEVRRLIKEGPKTGRIYKIRGRKHRASAPEEAPANLTGKLRRSVGFIVRATEVEYGYKIHYGKFLEHGTRKMLRRPGLLKAYLNKRQQIQSHFNNRFREQLERRV